MLMWSTTQGSDGHKGVRSKPQAPAADEPSMMLNILANGVMRDELLKAYQVLEPLDIDTCLIYAARLSDLVAAEGYGHRRIACASGRTAGRPFLTAQYRRTYAPVRVGRPRQPRNCPVSLA
jgi:hypothetical protein